MDLSCYTIVSYVSLNLRINTICKAQILNMLHIAQGPYTKYLHITQTPPFEGQVAVWTLQGLKMDRIWIK